MNSSNMTTCCRARPTQNSSGQNFCNIIPLSTDAFHGFSTPPNHPCTTLNFNNNNKKKNHSCFGLSLSLPAPSPPQRASLLAEMISTVPRNFLLNPNSLPHPLPAALISSTNGFSPADISRLVRVARLRAIENNRFLLLGDSPTLFLFHQTSQCQKKKLIPSRNKMAVFILLERWGQPFGSEINFFKTALG